MALLARGRQVYKPLEKTFDYRLKRTTDLKENSRVMLPKPLPTSEEAGLDTRRRTHMSMFNNYKEKNCNKWGDQKSNLTEKEEKGLKTLRKRIKEKELEGERTENGGQRGRQRGKGGGRRGQGGEGREGGGARREKEGGRR